MTSRSVLEPGRAHVMTGEGVLAGLLGGGGGCPSGSGKSHLVFALLVSTISEDWGERAFPIRVRKRGVRRLGLSEDNRPVQKVKEEQNLGSPRRGGHERLQGRVRQKVFQRFNLFRPSQQPLR